MKKGHVSRPLHWQFGFPLNLESVLCFVECTGTRIMTYLLTKCFVSLMTLSDQRELNMIKTREHTLQQRSELTWILHG